MVKFRDKWLLLFYKLFHAFALYLIYISLNLTVPFKNIAKYINEDIEKLNKFRITFSEEDAKAYLLGIAHYIICSFNELNKQISKEKIQIEDLFKYFGLITAKLTLCLVLNIVKMENEAVVAYSHLKALTLFGRPFYLFYLQFF